MNLSQAVQLLQCQCMDAATAALIGLRRTAGGQQSIRWIIILRSVDQVCDYA